MGFKEYRFLFPSILSLSSLVYVKIVILDRMAEIEYRLSAGTSEKLQLSSLIAAFQVARELTLQEEAA